MVNAASSGSLLVGTNDYLKDEAIAEIVCSVLNKAPKDLGLCVFYGGESTASQIIEQASTAPMPPLLKKVILVKRFDEFSSEDRIAVINYLRSKPKYAHIILETEDNSLAEECASAASFIDIRRAGHLDAGALAGWIRRYVASKGGKKIDNDALEALTDMNSAGMLQLSMELDKLLSFVGTRREIKLSDIESIVGLNEDIPAFGFADAIAAKDADRSLKIASELMRMGKSCHEIVGIICWQFKRMARAKSLKSAGRSDHEVASVLGLSRRYKDDFFRRLGCFTQGELASKMESLLEADISIKRTRFDPEALLELTIIKLCL